MLSRPTRMPRADSDADIRVDGTHLVVEEGQADDVEVLVELRDLLQVLGLHPHLPGRAPNALHCYFQSYHIKIFT